MEIKDLVIKPSDKGGNIVLMDCTYYIKMVIRLLNDRSTYEILTSNPTQRYLSEFKTILQDCLDSGCISPDEFKYMYNPAPTTFTFYTLSKVHKNKTPIPGRSIVSRMVNLTQGASKYVDTIFAPFVVGL